MSKNVAELLVDVLAHAGVRQLYGVSVDSLNGITEAIRERDDLSWIHVRHEETAAFAAGAEAHLTGKLAVCAGSGGPGNLHLMTATEAASRFSRSLRRYPARKSEAIIFRKPIRNTFSHNAVTTAS